MPFVPKQNTICSNFGWYNLRDFAGNLLASENTTFSLTSSWHFYEISFKVAWLRSWAGTGFYVTGQQGWGNAIWSGSGTVTDTLEYFHTVWVTAWGKKGFLLRVHPTDYHAEGSWRRSLGRKSRSFQMLNLLASWMSEEGDRESFLLYGQPSMVEVAPGISRLWHPHTGKSQVS